MRRVLLWLAATILVYALPVLAADYHYVAPADFKQWLESRKAMKIVDIQVPAEFQKQHIKGSIQTNAFPVKSTEDKQKLDKLIPQLAASQEDIVVVCPRGRGGAKNTYDYLKEKGIPEKRLFILTDGIQGWPYKELTASGVN
jgi:rhodanese-related sulfurtransferase